MGETDDKKRQATQPIADSDSRQLPAHIRAQLASAGGATDTAGQPWQGRNLGEGTSHTHRFPKDTGLTPPAVQDACRRFMIGEISEEDLVDTLRETRVFAPVVAEVSHAVITDEGLVADKESDMALISITAPDGRKALPLFTDVDSLTSWHGQARPVATELRRAALAAVEDDNQLIVINPGQNLTFVLRRPAVWAVARGEEWLPSYKDPEVAEELKQLIADIPAVRDVRIGVGQGVASVSADKQRLAGGGSGPEVKISLGLTPGLNQQQLDSAVAIFQQKLAASTVISERVDSIQLALEVADF